MSGQPPKVSIQDRLLKKAGSQDYPPDVQERQRFINKNGKFLSFVEKEKIMELVKARNPQVSELIQAHQQDLINKDQFKDGLFAILYPKREKKKWNESLKSISNRSTPRGDVTPKSEKSIRSSNVSQQSIKDEVGSATKKSDAMRSPTSATSGGAPKEAKKSIKKPKQGKNVPAVTFGVDMSGGDPEKIQVSLSDRSLTQKKSKTSINLVDESGGNLEQPSKEIDMDPNGTTSQVMKKIDEFLEELNKRNTTQQHESNEQVLAGLQDYSAQGVIIQNPDMQESFGGPQQQGGLNDSHEKDKPVRLSSKENSSPSKSHFLQQLDTMNKGSPSKLKQSTYSQKSKGPSVPGSIQKTRQNAQTPQDINLIGYSDKTKEVLQSLLSNAEYADALPNLTNTLRESQFIRESNNPTPGVPNSLFATNPRAGSYRPSAPGENIRASSLSPEKLITSPRKRIHPPDIDLLDRIEETYLSVSTIKKLFEENEVFAEDLVDELFRYLGEIVVNKNYFTQILTNYFHCLPTKEQYRVEEIASRIFDIIDTNKDGMVSHNDLGSGSMLFCKSRSEKSKERALVLLLDPQERGFILNTDIFNALKKADTIAKQKGVNLFENDDEIYEESNRLMKELDKENRGIVSFWDIFLWKDTHSFSILLEKLQTYTDELDSIATLKKSVVLSKVIPGSLEQKLENKKSGKGYESARNFGSNKPLSTMPLATANSARDYATADPTTTTEKNPIKESTVDVVYKDYEEFRVGNNNDSEKKDTENDEDKDNQVKDTDENEEEDRLRPKEDN